MTDLRRHVPPIALTWDDEVPGALWRVVDGTLVFADISGFTALTEKLSRRGRIGAEEIVETLNRVFGPMLRIAGARGGELLKFGGDALLFLFRGEGHSEQACDAAVEMRVALRQAAAVPTSVGRLSLSMSVGIHSGDVHLFLVGAPTRELLILGPAATQTALAEKAADAGQIVVSAETAGRLPAAAIRPREDGELLFRRRSPRTKPGASFVVPEVDRDRLHGLFPHELGRYLDPGAPDPEHRTASIAFIRFSGTDALLAGPGPEALALALDRTVSLVEEALVPEAISLLATDIDSDGGKFFLGAGIPTAFDDNEGRMLRALREIADAGAPLPLQLGVNRGHVFAAEVGIPERAAYTGMGDTTNTAARIMSKAPAGVLYAHPAVLEHSRTLFSVQPAGPFPMKGKAVPLLVFEVGEELGTREEATVASRLPFLGREEEIQTVRQALIDALAGAGGVVVVDGATGMGKSRLVFEAVEAITGAHVLVVRAEPYGAASAYRVFRDPVRRLMALERGTPEAMGLAMMATLSQVAPDLLPLAPLLADVVQVDVPSTPEVDMLDPQFRPDRLADAVVRFVDAALPGPLVLLAEEAHWADGASARLLDQIAAASAGRPWAVVVVRRGQDGGFAPATGTSVTLDPLPAHVMERLVIAATEATPLRPHEIAAIVDRAQGNPLFVEEVTRVALTTGSLDTLPDSVQAAMSAQIDLLHPDARRVLRFCAVLGRSFRVEVLRRTLAAGGLLAEPTLDGLRAFLEPDGPERWRFRNSLVRDAAYEGLAFRIRSRLHRAAGEALEAMSTDLDADSPTLALHFWRAGDAERTWRYAHLAGELARESYANVDAGAQFERALEVSRRVPGITDADRAAIWAVLGDLRESSGILDGSVEAFRRAADLTPDPVARAGLLARRAAVQDRAGNPVAALRLITRTRRLLASASGPAAARVLVDLDTLVASIRLGQERNHDARMWALRSAEEARAIQDSDTLAKALIFADYADVLLGTSGVGERTREALEICIASGDGVTELKARANLGGFAFYAGRWGEAVDWYRSSRAVAVKLGRVLQAAEIDLALGEILVHQGRAGEALGVLKDAVRVLRASGDNHSGAYGEMLLARVHLVGGKLAAADELAARVVAEFSDSGYPFSALEASLVRAEIALADDRPLDALAVVFGAENAVGEEGDSLHSRIHLIRARALLELDRVDEAGEAVELGLRAAQEQSLPFEEALLLQVRSSHAIRLGGADSGISAEVDAAEAERILTGLGARSVSQAP